MTGFVEDMVCFVRLSGARPTDGWATGQFAKFGGKSLRFCGPRALFAREMQRITDDDTRDVVSSREASQGTQVIPWIASRSSVSTGCAVRPNSSETATPMRFDPTSRAR